MMGITLQKSSSDQQYWKEHLAKQKISGLSVTVYCREHQLNYDRFYYWVRKEKRVAPRLIPIELKSVAAGNISTLPIEPPVLCTLTLRSGSVLAIHDKGIIPLILSALR
jgi:hypothetical protein